MNEFLVDYVRRNVWCNPYQDNQWMLALTRVSRRIGELNRFTLMGRFIGLPKKNVRYHVFQVGQVDPALLGLIGANPTWSVEGWQNLAETMVSKKLITNFYNVMGVEVPKRNISYMFTNDKALVIVVEEDRKIAVDYQQDQFYLRVYSNAFFETSRANGADDTIEVFGGLVRTLNDLTNFQSKYNNLAAKSGFVFAYRNGKLVSKLNAAMMALGDSVEMIRDGSVKRVVKFTLQDLPSFESTLDDVYKYLLHYNDGLNDTIDYQDDLDIYIMAPNVPNHLEGLYYHRNDVTAHRMVTHRDYSVPVDFVNFVVEAIKDRVANAPADGNTYTLQLVMRQAGYYRPLVFENSRIKELYKLSDDKALAAMVGLESSLDIWRAEALENCAYTQAMRVRWSDITQTLTQDVLGYNGMAKITGDTPSKSTLTSGQQMVSLPDGLQLKSTSYLYDFYGKLIGSQLNQAQQYVIAQDSATKLIETISGHGSETPNVLFGTDNVDIPTYYNYRVYRCYISGPSEDNDWEDITGTSEYSIVNGKVKLTAPAGNEFLMVRDDGSFLDITLTSNAVAGIYFFTMYEKQNRGRGQGMQTYPLPVPLGELDVFILDADGKGKSLIRGLDYVVDFPRVYVINKKYLTQPIANQSFRVRFTGFAKADGTLDEIEDYGFIQHGFLSNNTKFDIQDDKVLRITVDGALKHRDDIQFSEGHSGISITNATNGFPYQVKDIVVPLQGLEGEDTYSARALSQVIDEKVSDYLSVKLPEPDRGLFTIAEKYVLYSLFFSRIINGLKDGTLTGPFNQELSDMEVMLICRPFEYLLAFDPINDDNHIDYRYVSVHPHSSSTVITLPFFPYRFLTRVVKLYGRNMVDLSSHVSVS